MQANDRPLYIFDLDGTLALIDHRRPLVEAPWIEIPPHSIFDPGCSHGTNDYTYRYEDGRPYIRDRSFKPDWRAFYDACHLDVPNMPVVRTFNQLYTIGAELMIWSGREDSVQDKSIQWLSLTLNIHGHMLAQMLKMRPTGDFTPDEQLKRKWLNQLQPSQRQRLTAVFDDRDKVVKMWRGEGVACFQVAPGEF